MANISWTAVVVLCACGAAACGDDDGPAPADGGASGGRAPSGGASSGGTSSGGRAADGASSGGTSSDGASSGGNPSDDDGGRDASSGGVQEGGTADAGNEDAGESDAGPPARLKCDVARRVDGVLTNLWRPSFPKSGAIELETLCVLQLTPVTGNSFYVLADLVNRSASMQCGSAFRLTIGGQRALAAISMTAPRHLRKEDFNNAVWYCIPPGGRVATSTSLDATDRDAVYRGPTVQLTPDWVPATTEVPHPANLVLLSMNTKIVSGRYVVSGRVKAGSMGVAVWGMEFLVRDASGLIRNSFVRPFVDDPLAPAQEGTFVQESTEATPFDEMLATPQFLSPP